VKAYAILDVPVLENGSANPEWHVPAQFTWMPLGMPINATVTTPPTRAGVFYHGNDLYVIVQSFKTGVVPTDTSDFVSVYLDVTGEGKEMLQIKDKEGDAAPTLTWIRSSSTPTPRADGTPDFALPVSVIPDIQANGISCVQVEHAAADGASWVSVFRVPLESMPSPMASKASFAAESHWKINVIRSIVTLSAGKRLDQVQSHLSPMYIDSQAVSPYRMSPLDFTP
jgi:hypothetical protein